MAGDGGTERSWKRTLTQAKRERFLDHLAMTCDVRASVAAAGVSHTAMYKLRREDAAFAERWRLALLSGYDRLEAELLRKALAVIDADEGAAGAATAPLTVEQSIRVLDRHRASIERGTTGERADSRHRATQAETDALLLTRLKALRRARGRSA